MPTDPSYKKPGERSVIGSGLDPSAFPNLNKPIGEVTPAGFEKYPSGPKSVSFSTGATTPTVADGKARSQFMLK
jgi:hypothetical protein